MTFCSSLTVGHHGARFSALLLLFVLVPLAATIQVPQTQGYASVPLNCQPGVQNQYPVNATARQKIVIITTVSSACVYNYDQVIVNILLPNTSDLLSTGPASPATNTVTAPAYGGPWSLVVQVFWNDYPTGGTIEVFQTTITIKIIGPLAPTVTTTTAPYIQVTSSRTVAGSTASYSAATAVTVSSSTFSPFSIVISKSVTSTSASPIPTSESMSSTPSSIPSNQFWNILPFARLGSTGAVILAVVVVLLLVGVFVLKRRHK